jgi:hypothetical protein
MMAEDASVLEEEAEEVEVEELLVEAEWKYIMLLA